MKKYNRLTIYGKWQHFVVIFLVAGCGYSLSHRLRDVFQDTRGIFVPVFDNVTDEIGAEAIFTNALIRELRSRGEIVMKSREEGALELSGGITSIQVTQNAATQKGFGGLAFFRQLPTEVGISVELSLSLKDPNDHRVLWSNTFRGYRVLSTPIDRTQNYQAPSSLGETTRSLIRLTYSDIARDMMRDVYDDMVELF